MAKASATCAAPETKVLLAVSNNYIYAVLLPYYGVRPLSPHIEKALCKLNLNVQPLIEALDMKPET